MRMVSLVVASLSLLAYAVPARCADATDPVASALDRVLSGLPNDWYASDPAAAQQLIEGAKPFVLDVREPGEIASRIPGSVNVPLRALARSPARLPKDRATPIVVFCKVGYRGGMAVLALRMLGYTDVRNVRGGLDAWEKAGLPVEKVENRP